MVCLEHVKGMLGACYGVFGGCYRVFGACRCVFGWQSQSVSGPYLGLGSKLVAKSAVSATTRLNYAKQGVRSNHERSVVGNKTGRRSLN